MVQSCDIPTSAFIYTKLVMLAATTLLKIEKGKGKNYPLLSQGNVFVASLSLFSFLQYMQCQ